MIAEGVDPGAFLLKSLLETYLSFQQVVSAIDSANGHEVVLPSTTVKEIFSERASRYGISVDLWTFEIVRDLCSQLEVLNWHADAIDGSRMQRVFSTCAIRDDMGVNYETQNSSFPVRATILGRKVAIERNSPEFGNFRDILWNEYLKITNYVPRKPVFYSGLRSKVCYALRISDKTFDQFTARLLEKDDKYLLLAAGGSLPFSRDSAGMLKSLPPQTSRGQYIVYLKMDERRR